VGPLISSHKDNKDTIVKKFLLIVLLVGLAGCSIVDFGPPERIDNACNIVKTNPNWYRHMDRVEKKWGIPMSVQMAVIYQESKFERNARPPRKFRMGVIPAGYETTAYGYGQVLDGTWKWYQDSIDNRRVSRTNYGDVVEFIGWYTDISARELNISKSDAKNVYLAYHEGHGGYRKGSYRQKAWLIDVSNKVADIERQYRGQLRGCRIGLF